MEVDVRFFEYARTHRQCNATNESFFTGMPIFTCRTDTAIHFRNAVLQSRELLSLKGSGVELQKVNGATIEVVARLSDTAKAIAIFRMAVSNIPGIPANLMFTDVLEQVGRALATVPREQLNKHILIIAFIPVTNASGNKFCAWAVCPANGPPEDLLVAREDLNGTLVLATERNKMAHIMAYLTFTDNECGTFLIKTDKRGNISIPLKMPSRSDMGFMPQAEGPDWANREFRATINLKKDRMIAFGNLFSYV